MGIAQHAGIDLPVFPKTVLLLKLQTFRKYDLGPHGVNFKLLMHLFMILETGAGAEARFRAPSFFSPFPPSLPCPHESFPDTPFDAPFPFPPPDPPDDIDSDADRDLGEVGWECDADRDDDAELPP